MLVHWRRVLPLIVIAALIIFEDRVSIPSCEVVVPTGEQNVEENHPDDLKVMMVANLLLLGSEAGYRNIFFRDYYLSKFFAIIWILKPDMLLVLGDLSAKGSELTRSRDIGDCGKLNAISVNWLASNLPGLDSAWLWCLRNCEYRMTSGDFGWRENAMSSGSGPVLLLHFPLHWTGNKNSWGTSAYCGTSSPSHERSKIPESRGSVGTGPYDLLHTLPPNATEYIFQALRPSRTTSNYNSNGMLFISEKLVTSQRFSTSSISALFFSCLQAHAMESNQLFPGDSHFSACPVVRMPIPGVFCPSPHDYCPQQQQQHK
ncbi:hypothetical protein Acr_21g0006700 [Actinidia rufa]|uniref:Calcineurin-like metallo-phosphoesterase superfamily protein n=1 Tax=Actinidia rufa TaxID=165716 RepID=A0A7J0GH70_9ERIC|nr:hypothetical protein Acr_21g0006700 [Actinidia rufa]